MDDSLDAKSAFPQVFSVYNTYHPEVERLQAEIDDLKHRVIMCESMLKRAKKAEANAVNDTIRDAAEAAITKIETDAIEKGKVDHDLRIAEFKTLKAMSLAYGDVVNPTVVDRTNASDPRPAPLSGPASWFSAKAVNDSVRKRVRRATLQ